MLYDDGGSDTYQGKTFTQGAAGYGIGILYDDAVQAAPTLTTDEETKDPIDHRGLRQRPPLGLGTAQGFSRTLRRGALHQHARQRDLRGGRRLPARTALRRPLPVLLAGLLHRRARARHRGRHRAADRTCDGNDRYLGDIYNQGVGYWYAAGLLYDGGGNDHYEMTQYGQGSGIHLAVGGLIDVAGSDAYVMHSGLGQGGSHDYAASVFHDRAGNDRYHGNTSCNGDGPHEQRRAAHRPRGRRHLRLAPRRRLQRRAGPRAASGASACCSTWAARTTTWAPRPPGTRGRRPLAHERRGPGPGPCPPGPPDVRPPAAPRPPTQPSGKVEIPAICRYEGPLTQEVFDQLWAISVRWEVGDNRTIVPEARKRLIAFGKEILPHARPEGARRTSPASSSGRTWTSSGGLKARGAGAEVLDLLTRNLAGGPGESSGGPQRRTDSRAGGTQRASIDANAWRCTWWGS